MTKGCRAAVWHCEKQPAPDCRQGRRWTSSRSLPAPHCVPACGRPEHAPAELARWSDDCALRRHLPALAAPRRACSVEAMIVLGERPQARIIRSTEQARRGRESPPVPRVVQNHSLHRASSAGAGFARRPHVVQNHPLHRASSAGAGFSRGLRVVQNHALHRASSAGADSPAAPRVVQNHPLHRASSAGAGFPCAGARRSAESFAPPSKLGGGGSCTGRCA